VTAPRKKPTEPTSPRLDIPYSPSKEDLLELSEPTDYPKYPDHWFPEYPDLVEILEARQTRTGDREPHLEAEP
jgi:hypothetical protein